MSEPQIKLIFADDHEIFRDGFKVMLNKLPNVILCGEASNGEELVELAAQHQPDIVITDIKMPRMDGVEATRRISGSRPGTGIIALSMFDEEHLIVDMLEAGARGYLLKNAHKEEIREAILAVHSGQTYYCATTSGKLARLIARSGFDPVTREKKPEFNEKELAVIRYICQEMTNKEISEKMNLSIRTIEGYRDRVLDKIKSRNAAGIVVYAIRNKIFEMD